ncbi:MAG: T9SS type A sorting domain-containing protein, partial [Sphingobacteriales bacterium]
QSLGAAAFDAKSLSIYPVPAKDYLTVAHAFPIGSIRIYNQLGQEVYARNGIGNQADVDTSNLARGVYILHIYNAREESTYKIIKE